LATKTFPVDPDGWCETLDPADGAWSMPETSPHSVLELASVFVGAGNHSVHGYIEEGYEGESWYIEMRFTLFNGREFDGTKQDARLHVYLAAAPGSDHITSHEQWVYLYDAAGNIARRKITTQVGVLEHFTWMLGPDQGWEDVSGNFDWRFIKAVGFPRWGFLATGPDGGFYVDELHFSYYELELARLTVLSEPPGKQFRINGEMLTTPMYNLGILPNVDHTVSMDPTDFQHWENGSTNPQRTINLGEGEELTIIAYYEGGGPPPGKGKIHAVAYAGTRQVQARVEIEGVGTYYTPFEVDLDPGTYNLTAYYKDETDFQQATVVEGETTPVTFHFTAPAPSFNMLYAVLGVAFLAGAIAIVIYPEELKKMVGW